MVLPVIMPPNVSKRILVFALTKPAIAPKQLTSSRLCSVGLGAGRDARARRTRVDALTSMMVCMRRRRFAASGPPEGWGVKRSPERLGGNTRKVDAQSPTA
eukprot:5776764-Prymnesium_polylepis.1